MNEFDISRFSNRTTKGELAKILGVCQRSVFSYHKIALESLDEYDSDFFSYDLGNGKKHLVSNIPLTIYQCWCLWSINRWIKEGLPVKILKELLKQHVYQEKISKQAFQQFLNEIPEYDRHTENTYQGLCKAA